jgi:hypothetical protein
MNVDPTLSPAEAYLAELSEANHPRAVAVYQAVAEYQGYTDWRLAQWQNITSDDLPGLRQHLQTRFSDPESVQFAIRVIKGVTRCAWRQNLMPVHQLTEIGKWKE